MAGAAAGLSPAVLGPWTADCPILQDPVLQHTQPACSQSRIYSVCACVCGCVWLCGLTPLGRGSRRYVP